MKTKDRNKIEISGIVTRIVHAEDHKGKVMGGMTISCNGETFPAQTICGSCVEVVNATRPGTHVEICGRLKPLPHTLGPDKFIIIISKIIIL